MLQTFAKDYPKTTPLERDADYPERCFWLELYGRIYEGTLYDSLQYGFFQETKNLHKWDVHEQRTTMGQKTERIPLLNRRPAAQVNLAKIIVNDSTSLLFDDSHFPCFKTKNENIKIFIDDIYKNTKLKCALLHTAIIGSLGSSAILLQIFNNKLCFKPFKTQYLTPEYDPENPEEIIKVTEKYKITARQVRKLGYKTEKYDGDYWFCREWTSKQEIYYHPWKVIDEREAITEEKEVIRTIDEKKTINHDFEFVPFIWIKNLPRLNVNEIDGECTFESIIQNMIEIDYQLSQLGRGLKYSAEPVLLIKTDQDVGGSFDKSQGNALCLDAKSDAKMLEIKGDFAEVVIKYCETLRKLSLEVIGANRADPERLHNAQSGKALEMMNQSLVWLVSKLRVSYGEALEALIKMIIKATENYRIDICRNSYEKLKEPDDLLLIWPPFFLPTSQEKQADATTLVTLKNGGLISSETAVQNLSANYDVIEPDDEMKKIESEHSERENKEINKVVTMSEIQNKEKVNNV